jgi:hypothetical protein
VYLIAALCGLYLSVAPLVSRWHGPVSFFTVCCWIGAVFLLLAATIPPGKANNILITRLAMFGSTLTTVVLLYGIARFLAFRLGYIHGKEQLGVYQPNALDRLNAIVSRPILFLFLISSLASLVISAVITLHLRNRSGSPKDFS